MTIITLGLRALRTALIYCIAGDVIPCLIGTPGCGKTTTAVDLAEAEGHIHMLDFDPSKGHTHHYMTLVLGAMEPCDVNGIPMPDDKTGTTKYYSPAMLKLASEYPGTIILDEADRSAPETQNAALRDIQNGVIGNIKLHPDTRIVVCMNGETDIHTTPLSEAAKQRFCFLYVVPEKGEWVEYELARWSGSATAALAIPRMEKVMSWTPTDIAATYQCYNRCNSRAIGLGEAYAMYRDLYEADRAVLACFQGLVGNANAVRDAAPWLLDAELQRIDVDADGEPLYSVEAILLDSVTPIVTPTDVEKKSALTGCLNDLCEWLQADKVDPDISKARAKDIQAIAARIDKEARASIYSGRKADSCTHTEYKDWCEAAGYRPLAKGKWTRLKKEYGSPWLTLSTVLDKNTVNVDGSTGISPNYESLLLWSAEQNEDCDTTRDEYEAGCRRQGIVPDVGFFN